MPKFDYDGYIATEKLSDEQLDVLHDVKNYQSYLTEPKYFDAGLTYLEAQLALAKTRAEGSLGKVLSNELADKEVRCGLFEPGVNLYYMVLSEDAFNHLARQRQQFKDVGAGFVHGEYTHRIQWYVCMYHQTRGFLDESYADPTGQEPRTHRLRPAELFERIMLFGLPIPADYWPRRKVSGGGHLWDTLFDRNSPDVDDTDGITSPEAFNKSLFDVSKLQSLVGLGLSETVGKRSLAYPTLSAIVTARYLKRTQGISPETNEELIAYATKKCTKVNPKTSYTTWANPDQRDDTRAQQFKEGVLISTSK